MIRCLSDAGSPLIATLYPSLIELLSVTLFADMEVRGLTLTPYLDNFKY